MEDSKSDQTEIGREEEELSEKSNENQLESGFFQKQGDKLVHLLRENGLPMISYAKAGQDGFFEDFYPFGGADEYIKPLCTVKDPSRSFCIEVRGDSMEPRYLEGEIAVICTTSPYVPKDFVLIKTKSGEVSIKQYFMKGNKIVAHSLNPKYEDQFFDPQEIIHMFKIIGSQART